MFIKKVVFASAMVFATLANASDFEPVKDKLNSFLSKFGEHVLEIKESENFPGLLEAVGQRSNGQKHIFFSNKKGDLILVNGLEISVSETGEAKNLTTEKMAEMEKIDFNGLPFDLALKEVKGDGSRKIALFEDPNCGYCKKFRQETLEKVDNVTIYTFPIYILGEKSELKVNQTLCSKNPLATWKAIYMEGKDPVGPTSCDANKSGQIKDLAKKVGVTGTPAFFLADGYRKSGALPLDALNIELDKVYKK